MGVREQLTMLAPPPVCVSPYARWSELQSRLGFVLPGDYRWLVDTYGSGSFDDFIYVFVPESSFPAIRLEMAIVRARRDLESLRRSLRVRFPFIEDELLPIARTDNADVVYLVMRPGRDADSWAVAVLEGGGVRWTEFAGGLVSFLVSLLGGEFKIDYFPEDLPSGRVAFEKVPEPPDCRRIR